MNFLKLKSKKIYAVLLAEIIFLIASFIYNVGKNERIIIGNTDFNAFQDVGIEISEEGVYIPQGCNGTVVSSRDIKVVPGIYDITIDYEGGGDDVSVWFNNSTIRSGNVVLKSGRNTVSFRAWVSTAKTTETLHFNTGGSSFRIKQVVMNCNGTVYAVYSFIIVFLLFLTIDVCWYMWQNRDSFKGKRATLVNAAGIAGIAIMASMPLFVRSMVPGIDIVFHLHRIEGIAQAISAGQFPVRVQLGWYEGRSYPVSIFYGDILLYIPALLRLAGFSIQDAYKFYIVVMNLSTAYITWYCLRKMMKNDAAAMMGSLLYTVSVYRYINVYVRAALGEATAMTFFPLIVYGLWKILSVPKGSKQPKGNWICMTLAFTGIILSHVLSCEIAVVITALTCLIYIKKVFRKDVLMELLKAVGATLVLTLWFIVPFLDFMQDKYNIAVEAGFGLEDNAAFLGQMFGLNYSGRTDRYSLSLNSGVHDEMSMGVGFVLLLGVVLFIVVTILMDGHKKNPVWKLGNFCMWMAVLCIWLSSDLFPWGNIIQLSEKLASLVNVIQFSWRFLSVATICMVITTCCAITLSADVEKHRLYTVLAVLFVLNTVTWGNFVETSLVDNNNAVYYSYANLDALPWGNDDYLPYGSDYWNYVTVPELTSENVNVAAYDIQPLKAEISCTAGQDGSITLPWIYYRHYTAYDKMGGQKFTVSCDDKYNVRIDIPAGFVGNVIVKFSEPWFWRVAEIISAVSLMCGIVYMVRVKKTENNVC